MGGGPITQDTSLETMNLGGSLKIALIAPGQSIGRLAWVPRRITPYVGAGAAMLKYDFMQQGDFVDFVDLKIFSDTFQTTGWTPSAHAFIGTDVAITRSVLFTVEGRYQWAAGDLGRTFADFEPIDLAGFRATGGVSFRF